MPLPEVTASGEKPYVVCSIHPVNGALSVAVTPRTIGGKFHVTPLADIKIKGGSTFAPVGIFGRFTSLSIEFDEDVEGFRVFAQNMLSDEAQDVTERVMLSGRTLTIDGSLMLSIGSPEDTENGIPGVVMKIISD
jgi:hypothetical protein